MEVAGGRGPCGAAVVVGGVSTVARRRGEEAWRSPAARRAPEAKVDLAAALGADALFSVVLAVLVAALLVVPAAAFRAVDAAPLAFVGVLSVLLAAALLAAALFAEVLFAGFFPAVLAVVLLLVAALFGPFSGVAITRSVR